MYSVESEPSVSYSATTTAANEYAACSATIQSMEFFM